VTTPKGRTYRLTVEYDKHRTKKLLLAEYYTDKKGNERKTRRRMQFGGGTFDLPAILALVNEALTAAVVSGDFDPNVFLADYGVQVPPHIVNAAVNHIKAQQKGD
jgi:hypothetical protein